MKTHRTAIASLKSNPSKIKEYLMRFDFLQFVTVLFLLGNGLLFIYSTGFQNEINITTSFFYKQIFWILVSLPLYFTLSNFDYRYLKVIAVPMYLLCIILLVAVLIFGIKIYGARRWLDFGFFNLQPSELMKLSFILALSYLLSTRNFVINQFSSLFMIGVMLIVPFLLIFVEPDLGSALILIPIALGLVFVAGLSRKLIITGVCVMAVAASLLTANEFFKIKPLLKPYHRARIMAFINPDQAPSDMTYQQRQSQIAVGSGGLTGKGIGKGTQHTLGYLPQSAANNDFIFSVIAEEGGFIWGGGIILAYLILCLRILYIGLICEDNFGRFLAIGIGIFLFSHVFVNIGVNIGLAPVTGLPLPFISYGGSFILVALCALGITQSISFYNK